jgi:ribose 1,5-bisphosphokinase
MAPVSSDTMTRVINGVFVGIVGPSGAGKDSVMARAQAMLHGDSSIMFPQRIVTRPPDATECNVAISLSDFERLRADGGFALSWAAHNLSYAVPVEIDAFVVQGSVVVVNVSRSVVPLLRDRYIQGRVVLIDAPAHIRRARLAQRGREDDLSVHERLGRKVDDFQVADADFAIDNSGTIDAAAQRLADYLASLKRVALQAGSA